MELEVHTNYFDEQILDAQIFGTLLSIAIECKIHKSENYFLVSNGVRNRARIYRHRYPVRNVPREESIEKYFRALNYI